jgi:superfamily II DNA or RNA helicase
MNYSEFLESKQHSSENFGIEPSFIPNKMFDFQKYGCEYLIRKGRGAGFLDTGLGKTLIELITATNYTRATNKPVLIITPLAVAFQFIKEATKFGIDDVEYSKDGKYKSKIVICNYERIHHFTPSDFDCVILDESSILKNPDGIIRGQITSFLKKVKYRYLFTATPSPNDYIELGTSSEALGYLGHTDMLGKFFKNNNNNTVKIGQIDKARIGMEWYLKPHAERDFWRWVSSWSLSCRKPSDLGFSDDLYKLPELIENEIVIANKNPLAVVIGEGKSAVQQGQLYNMPAINWREIKAEVRATINERCEAAVEAANHHKVSVYWCNLNPEGALLRKLDKDAYEISGKMDIDEKEEILLAFSNGEIKKLITKASMTSFGLNWQHCNHTVYFPTFSYEQYYQAIRRFWRFGQKKPVYVDKVISDGQSRIIDALEVKNSKAESMFKMLVEQTNNTFNITKREFNKPVTLPSFI